MAGVLEVVPAAGETLASWQIVVLPDLPPSIGFSAPPGATHRHVLEVAYEASDDYGLRKVALNFALVGRPSESDSTVLAEPARSPGTLASTAYADLTAHPLAGLEVELQLVATDGLGQQGASETAAHGAARATVRAPARPCRGGRAQAAGARAAAARRGRRQARSAGRDRPRRAGRNGRPARPLPLRHRGSGKAPMLPSGARSWTCSGSWRC